MENITCSLPKQAIYYTFWYKNMIQNSMQGFAEKISSVMILCFVENYMVNTCTII